MIFNPKKYVPGEGHYRFAGAVEASAHSCLAKAAIADFWKNFSYGMGTLTISAPAEELIFRVGSTEALPLEGHDYAIRVEEDGI